MSVSLLFFDKTNSEAVPSLFFDPRAFLSPVPFPDPTAKALPCPCLLVQQGQHTHPQPILVTGWWCPQAASLHPYRLRGKHFVLTLVAKIPFAD